MRSVLVASGPAVGVELVLDLVLSFVLIASANYIRSNSHIFCEQKYVQSVIRTGTKVAKVSLLNRRVLFYASQRYSFRVLITRRAEFHGLARG